MGYPLVGGELELACDLVTSRIAWLDLDVEPGDASFAVDTGEVARGSATGLAQLAAWRERVERGWQRAYGEPQPPHIAATFVLGWYLDALAYPAAYAAELGPWVLDLSPGVVVEPHPSQHFPHRVHLAPGGAHEIVASVDVRRRKAERGYRDHAERVAAAYSVPGVKMSSRQRLGMVDDLWHVAQVRARAGAGSPLSTPSGDNEGTWLRCSCCFIYALPGASLCSTCPRRATRGTATPPSALRFEE